MSAPLGGLLPCSAHAATDDFMRIDKLPDEARRMLKEANDRRQQSWWCPDNDEPEVRRVDASAAWYQLLAW